ncbi:MAG: hypothetical protein A4E19_04210 [Nitrospira sp. SG-bin1]|nr:MAG: hypothetical protein A4E19_04210 [Nitrospira sp. SG-bin1]
MRTVVIIAVIALALEFQDAIAQENLLVNGTFEAEPSRNDVVQGWYINAWPETMRKNVLVESVQAPAPHSGSAQAVTVKRLEEKGGVIFAQPVSFGAGKVYEASISVYSSSGAYVQLVLREKKPPYREGAVDYKQLRGGWEDIRIRGGFDEDIAGVVGLRILSESSIIIDDARLKDITRDVLNNGLDAAERKGNISRRFFGMHINKLGTHLSWPSTGFGVLRLWDTGTNWADLEPERGVIRSSDWSKRRSPVSRLQFYLDHVAKQDRDCEVMLTLAVTPMWASRRSSHPYYKGTANPPTLMDDWRMYVGELGQRLRGRVRYWEIWNESDQAHQFNGTVEELLAMTKTAAEELKRSDPENLVSSPNITAYGLGLLDRFLDLGGGAFVDYVSWHYYPTTVPENSLPLIVALRDVLKRHSLDDVPVLNTEGRVRLSHSKEKALLSDDQAIQLVMRSYLVQLALGIDGFIWYVWDDDTEQTVRLWQPGVRRYEALSPAGLALKTLSGWLVGKKVQSVSVSWQAHDDQVWRLELVTPKGEHKVVLWRTNEKPLDMETRFEEWVNMLTSEGNERTFPTNQTPKTSGPILLH